jgi:hypothetical protein
MASVTVGVEGRRSGVGGEVSQSPRFSASLIGLRSLGFVWALWARRTLVPVPRLAPLLLWRCARGATAIHGRRPRSGRGLTGFPIRRSRDHFPNINCSRKESHFAISGIFDSLYMIFHSIDIFKAILKQHFTSNQTCLLNTMLFLTNQMLLSTTEEIIFTL